MYPYNKKLVSNARTLRKNMTDEEKHLWYDFLKKIPYNVRRQHNIKNYIVDFYIARKKLVIEIDGIQHTMRDHEEADMTRDAELAAMGIKVLRYSNKSVRENFSWVVQNIMDNLEPRTTSEPSPEGEGGPRSGG